MKTKLVLLLIAALILSGCGNSKSSNLGSNQQSSLEVPSDDDILPDGKVLSYCNHTGSTKANYKLALHAYVESGTTRNDLMYAMLTQLPADFKTAGERIRFFRWKSNASGTIQIDENPLSFRLVNPIKGEELLSERTSMVWGDVKAIATSMNLPVPVDFFRRAFFIVDLNDDLLEYHGIIMSAYNSGGTVSDQINALLPLFNVDPNGYKNPSTGVTRPDSLVNLHPYVADLGQTLSLSFNKERVQALCSPWSAP